MELTQLLILQLIGHILTDFFFQSNAQALDKNKLGIKSKFMWLHIPIAFALSLVLSFQINFICAAAIIALTHLLIDSVKPKINNSKLIGKYSFFIDQFLHLVVIGVVVFIYDKYCDNTFLFDIDFKTKTLLIIAGYLLCMKPTNIYIKEIFKVFEIKMDTGNDLPNAGKLIGSLERLLVLTFILLAQFEAVGFLIAAKSILRYKDDETIKTEYVLIGTMLSFGIAVGIGITISLIP